MANHPHSEQSRTGQEQRILRPQHILPHPPTVRTTNLPQHPAAHTAHALVYPPMARAPHFSQHHLPAAPAARAPIAPYYLPEPRAAHAPLYPHIAQAPLAPQYPPVTQGPMAPPITPHPYAPRYDPVQSFAHPLGYPQVPQQAHVVNHSPSPPHGPEQPPAPGVKPAVVVGARGRFLGSTGSLFLKQAAADLYFQDYWTSVGVLRRVVVSCTVWGLSIALVQKANRLPGNVDHTPWVYDPLSLVRLSVVDHGHQHRTRADVPLQPHEHLIPQNRIGTAMVNGVVRVGYVMAWHHKVVLKLGGERVGQRMHYHEHARRQNTNVPPILPQGRGKHVIFEEVTYSTQVQNCRRVKGRNE